MGRYLIGDTLLGQFRVDEFIATGGMSAVYKIWDLQRNVPLAMKVLNADLSRDPAFMHRFEREARALESLAHPNIVQFYGLHQTPELTFLLERYVDGPSLSDILRYRAGAPFPIYEVLVYLKALASGLGYAHSKGIIHCDIKPGNILIDQGGHIYLTDFGIAKYTESVTTTTYTAVGTPAYMAPEQVRAEHVSPQTDIYSLGVLLYELLAGQRPFRGDEQMPTTQAGVTQAERIRYAHLNLQPPNPHTVNPQIPVQLGEAVQVALAKEPQDRYSTVHEMALAVFTAVQTRAEMVPDRIRLPDDFLARWNSVYPVKEEQKPARIRPRIPFRLSRPAWLTRRTALGLGVIAAVITLCLIAFAGLQTIQGFFPSSRTRTPTLVFSVPSVISTVTLTPPRPVTAAPPGKTQVSISSQGQIAAVINQAGKDHLYLVDAASSVLSSLPDPPDAQWSWAPQWSPDGNKLVWFSNYGNRAHIVVLDFQSQQRFDLNSADSYDSVHSPAWLPDGKQVSFWASRAQAYWLVVADGSTGLIVQETQLPNYRNQFVWNWKSNLMAFVEKPANQYNVVISASSQTDDQVIQADGENYAPAWSNDGVWLAFQSDRNRAGGEDEIWIIKSDGSGLRQVTQSAAGVWCRAPTWSPDGSQIAFVSNQSGSLKADYGELFTVDVESGAVHQLTQTGGQVYDWRPAWRPK